ncbi:hypothetical protein Rsub_06231 [Raphidocelis subcapitata]|uniref:UspA domain-containing protein n=1 Tax=Raphidocelis subcapitata TaxID=307507 RepID=A0A2V0P4Z3_9CHLO|nr:hypothetical protein Rsub_06231 [Raphidocelis subcapitata]|eukprot:GBF93982.1 hypothetical protein Rsub_06231 [Raphidocelis subcapitata]
MRTIVVGQASMERRGLEFAASELWVSEEATTLVLVHTAAVLAPNATVLHSAPQTTYATGGGDVEEMHAKVSKALRKRVLPCAEARGVPVVLQVKLLHVEATARDAADALVAAAKEHSASVLVVARDAGDVDGGSTGGDDDSEASGVHVVAGRALERLVKGGSLVEEVLLRSSGLAVAVVPAGWEALPAEPAPEDAAGAKADV